jgi:hypothetical protein
LPIGNAVLPECLPISALLQKFAGWPVTSRQQCQYISNILARLALAGKTRCDAARSMLVSFIFTGLNP